MRHLPSLLSLLLIPFFGYSQKVVVSSASIFQDMASRIGGDRILSKTIVPIGSDPHTYEPTPSDVAKIQSADLLLVNGLTFEEWINNLIANSGTVAPTVRITEGIDAIASDKYDNAYDPHAWMNVAHGLIYIANIKDALIAIDAPNAAHYQANHDVYRQELIALDHYIETAIQTIPANQRVLITSHDAFAYYGRRYGLTLNAIMGISTEAEARGSDIIRVSNAIKSSGVPAIFIESTINPKLINQVAADNGVSIGGELFADSIGEKGGPGDSYIKMLRHNTDVIVAALSKAAPAPQHGTDQSQGGSMAYLLILGVVIVALLLAIVKLR